MRLPIAISAGLLISLGLNAPVLSQVPIQVAQLTTIAANPNAGQLKNNRQLWNDQNISNYRYTLTRSCFCTAEARGPVVVEVRNGATSSVTLVATGQPVAPDIFKEYDTVPKLFNVIKEAIAGKASSLTVEYNSTLGYPTQINIDYNSQIADEEVYLTIENFQVIN
ncbi:DUF6174 domain-containing protein [Cylindrospermum sp. FACHB-282]|uniref:DUF6174 domain-containing protein n=1 Tax=Cylindrospermum sp. FACHB-282 TaxID=2692794 RepID=UPI00168365FC|nr:DUF6174 domain-containing protein [Cylindrospermum sp. FACHB-282]MBD2388842.1 hypothetical protein [Cylindrospermum sp. FACHB-282]